MTSASDDTTSCPICASILSPHASGGSWCGACELVFARDGQ